MASNWRPTSISTAHDEIHIKGSIQKICTNCSKCFVTLHFCRTHCNTDVGYRHTNRTFWVSSRYLKYLWSRKKAFYSQYNCTMKCNTSDKLTYYYKNTTKALVCKNIFTSNCPIFISITLRSDARLLWVECNIFVQRNYLMGAHTFPF